MDIKTIIKTLKDVEIEPTFLNIKLLKNALDEGHDLDTILMDLKEWADMDIKIF